MKNFVFVFATLFICIVTGDTLHAQIPRTLSYQGVLTDNAGKPRPDGNYTFKFCLYGSNSGGSPIWCESKSLPVKNGLFSTMLGEQTPFGAAVKFDRQYWLGIQVGNEPELSPRMALTSVGYSFSSLRADTASVAMSSSSGVFYKEIIVDLRQNSGNAGRQGLALIASPDNSEGVLLVNKPRFLLYSQSEQRVADLSCAQVQASSVVSHGEIIVDLRQNSGSAGRQGLALIASPDNSEGVLLVNKPRFLLYSQSEQRAADLSCGDASVRVLTIRGGADLAEPFEISESQPIPKGALVIIDEENPGQLKLSHQAYDKRVAGVVSGAGGINPGLTLTQEGVLEGGQNVALTGRVYALATAANGPIKPGDLLTTSEVAGHAMKATDRELSNGAIIGKAMSSLENGEGLVLVLVNLQ